MDQTDSSSPLRFLNCEHLAEYPCMTGGYKEDKVLKRISIYCIEIVKSSLTMCLPKAKMKQSGLNWAAHASQYTVHVENCCRTWASKVTHANIEMAVQKG